jgi:glucose-1-phosphate thymidylyltransferase
VSAARVASRVVGILLAGGSGTRMRPLTERMNKHLIPVHMRPMIEYPLGTLLSLGVTRVLVVTGRRHMGPVVELLGSGREYGAGVDFTFKVQEEAGGIAAALALGEEFAAGRRVAVVLGDNVFDDDGLAGTAREFAAAQDDRATLFLAEVPEARAYGVATIEDGVVTGVEEKPAAPRSNLVVTGLYLYPPDVFDLVRRLEPSARGELEISEVNDAYARAGRVRHRVVRAWFDAGEPGPWMRTQRHVAEHPERFGPERFRRPE